MAFSGIIDAVTGPSFKMPDGSAKVMTVAEGLEAVKDEVVEKTTVVIEQAKDNLEGPLNKVISAASEITKKALPTAIASCASLQYTGGQGTFSSFLQPAYLRSKHLYIGEDRHDRIGYPLEAYRVLSTLTGFVQCVNVRLDLAATATAPGATLEEQQLIKQYLEAGCFIE